MPDYLYAVVDCKTPGCGNVIAVRYLGKGNRPREIKEHFAGQVKQPCLNCGKSRLYDVREYRVQSYPFAPPKGWARFDIPRSFTPPIEHSPVKEQQGADPDNTIRISFFG